MDSDEHDDPSAPSPEHQEEIRRERARVRTFNLSEILILEKSRHWLKELHDLASPVGFHRNRPKRESLRTRIKGILETLSEFEADAPEPEEHP